MLACSIRQNENVQGIKIGNEEIKLTLFADDISCFLRNKSSYEHLVCMLEEFSVFSGLKVNREKTEFFYLGSRKLETFPQEFKTVKNLAVCFSYNEVHRKKENFEKILKSIRKTLNRWK